MEGHYSDKRAVPEPAQGLSLAPHPPWHRKNNVMFYWASTTCHAPIIPKYMELPLCLSFSNLYGLCTCTFLFLEKTFPTLPPNTFLLFL